MMVSSRNDDVIVAQCTPRGSGALAMLRLSGQGTLALAHVLIKLPQSHRLDVVPSHTIHFGWVFGASGAKIDQVMVSVMHAPRTFTGQDTVEITCHNNQYIIDDIIARCLELGARLAQPGEFSERAFLNGKIDLVQAEALNELIHASTQHALKKSLAQLEGTFSHWIVSIEAELMRSLAWCEASFEFLDEEQEFGEQIKVLLEGLLVKLSQMKQSFNAGQLIRQGVRVALIGSVNAGKSSLFNSLLGLKRSIVTSVPGTTRDTVEAGASYNGLQLTFIDTAGIRVTDDVIEAEGIERSLAEGKKADIVLLIFDGSRELSVSERDFYTGFLRDYSHKVILVHNKADILYQSPPFAHLSPLRVSSQQPHTSELLKEHLQFKLADLFGHAFEAPFLLNERHCRLVLSLEKKLREIVGMLSGVVHYELVSFHLRAALETITELTGKSISEAGLDTVFREFCVGK